MADSETGTQGHVADSTITVDDLQEAIKEVEAAEDSFEEVEEVEKDGYIEKASETREDAVRQQPWPLPEDLEWSTADLDDSAQLQELYDLLYGHYVEDDDAELRFQYKPEFLEWALKPPGWKKDWHVGIRTQLDKKLVGFFAGIPMTLRIRDKYVLGLGTHSPRYWRNIKTAELNFLCVHKEQRGRGLAPTLIKETARRVQMSGIFWGFETAGRTLPKPVDTCRYYHRCLNIPKLVDIGFTQVPGNSTLERTVERHAVPSEPNHISSTGAKLREMEERDIAQVADLYTRNMKRFSMSPVMTVEEVKHYLYSGRGVGDEPPDTPGGREKQITWSYVVEDPETQEITDFFVFYSLPTTILNNPKYDVIDIAYLFYYGSSAAFAELDEGEKESKLRERLQQLIGDAVIIANKLKFDVLNAMELMDGKLILRDLKFGAGDGRLNYYVYDWRLASQVDEGEPSGVEIDTKRPMGVVML